MRYVVTENGEVLETLEDNENYIKTQKGDRVVRSSSLEWLEDTIPVKIKFIKLNPATCEELAKYGSELFCLFKYVHFQTGILVFSNGNKVRPKHLAGILHKKRRSGSRVIAELIEQDILHKHKEGTTYYYTMNPWVCLKGRRVSKSLYEEFMKTKYRDIEWEYN